MADTRAEHLIRRWRSLRDKRSVWHQHWDDLARVMLPRRLGFASTPVEGESRTEDIFDGTPMQAARGLANAVGGMLRPEGQQWFFLRADEADQDEEAKLWLAEAEERLIAALENPRARFRQATGEADLDLVVFGTPVIFVGEGKSLDHLLFQAVHPKDAVAFFSDEGAPEGVFRLRSFTMRQAEDRFGRDNLSEPARRKLEEKKFDETIDILHAVVPREEGRAGALLAQNLPWANIWLEVDAKHEISVGGFHEFPFVVPRWDTSSGEDYGRSPGMIALPDANTLQAMGETLLVAGQRSADPPLMAPNDGAFSEVNTFPGGLSYYDIETAATVRGNPFFALEPGSNMPLTLEMQSGVREQVFAAFFRNVLNLPVDGPEMTATEVIQRKEEFIREIGPVFGRLETDYTAPMIERAFMVMLRAGALPPIPPALRGANVRFEYESPVKKIRQQTEAAAAKMWAAEMANMAQFKPEALDLINVDALGRFTAEAVGIPHEIVNGRETVEEIRRARAQQEQAQAEATASREVAEIAKTGADAAKQAGLTP